MVLVAQVAMFLANIDRDKLVAAAGGDPWEVNASVQLGHSAHIDRLAQAFHYAGRSATAAEDVFVQAQKRFEQAWDCRDREHSLNDSSEVQFATNRLAIQALQLPQIAVDLEFIAAALTEAQRTSATCIKGLEKQIAQTDRRLGDFIDLEGNHYITDETRSLISSATRGLDQQAVDDTKAALQQVVHIRDAYIGTLHETEDGLRSNGYDSALFEALDTPLSARPKESGPPLPSPNTNPGGVSKWWKALSHNDKIALISGDSPELGNLNGIPVDVRSAVNQAVMNDDVDRVHDLANRHGVAVEKVLRNPGWYGLSTTDVCRYINACMVQQGLAASAQTQDENGDTPPLYLLKYQPAAFGGAGAAAIAMGNPDTAVNTAVVVKGLGSGVRRGTLTNPDGRRLFHEANCADWSEDTAVVMWSGYDTPNSATDPRLYQPNLARAGGRALAADVNALAVTHQGMPAHTSVVGHSYGSTTVADAAAGSGMRAHDVVLLGCPGTDLARSAADFHLPPGGHLYVGDASQDEVSWLGHYTERTPIGDVGLGLDPAMDGYGSTRFKAEVVGYQAKPFYDHSHYFDDGSESLFSLGDIVSGHGDALTTRPHDGAAPR